MVTTGTVYRYNCRVTAFPSPDIEWNHVEDDSVKTDVYCYSRGEIFSYIISDFQLSDAGTYVCEARNRYGTASTSIRLHALAVKEGNTVGDIAGEKLKSFGNYS